MHDTVVLLHDPGPADDLHGDSSVKDRRIPNGQHGYIEYGTDDKKYDPDRFHDIDLTEAEYTKQNEELQKASANVNHLQAHDQLLKRPRLPLHQIPKARDGNQCEHNRKVYVKMLMPHVDIRC